MHVGYCILVVDTQDALSLKEKRNVLRSIKNRLRQSFNVSIAEIDLQDRLTEGMLGLVSISGDRQYLEGQLQKLSDAVERQFPGRTAHFESRIETILPGEG